MRANSLDLPDGIVAIIAAAKLMASQFPADPCGQQGVHPFYVQTLRTRLWAAGFTWETKDNSNGQEVQA